MTHPIKSRKPLVLMVMGLILVAAVVIGFQQGFIITEDGINGKNGGNGYEILPVTETMNGGSPPVAAAIEIVSPESGATVTGIITISIAVGNNEIDQVSLYIDGSFKMRDLTKPFSFSWDTSGYSQGVSHTLKVVGKSLTSSFSHQMTVKIAITAAAPTPTTTTETISNEADVTLLAETEKKDDSPVSGFLIFPVLSLFVICAVLRYRRH